MHTVLVVEKRGAPSSWYEISAYTAVYSCLPRGAEHEYAALARRHGRDVQYAFRKSRLGLRALQICTRSGRRSGSTITSRDRDDGRNSQVVCGSDRPDAA
jgi:hypothetical protein